MTDDDDRTWDAKLALPGTVRGLNDYLAHDALGLLMETANREGVDVTSVELVADGGADPLTAGSTRVLLIAHGEAREL